MNALRDVVKADKDGLKRVVRANDEGLERAEKVVRPNDEGLKRAEKVVKADDEGLERAEKVVRADDEGLQRDEKVVKADENGLKRAEKVVKAGGTIVYPTDTLYGLGCALNNEALKRIYELKRMPPVPLSLVMSGIEMMMDYAILPSPARRFLATFPAGPFTLLLPVNDEKDIPAALIKDGHIGVRIPLHGFSRALAERAGPIISTSANVHGEPAPSSFDDVKIEGADLYVDDGGCLYGVESTILKVTFEGLEIVREGALSYGTLKEYLEEFNG